MPSGELWLPSRYNYEVSDPNLTGLRVHSLTSNETGVRAGFVEYNQAVDVHTTVAWAQSRASRSEDTFEEVLAQIHAAHNEGKKSAADFLRTWFGNYGHSSIGDLAPITILLEDVSIRSIFRLFNMTSTSSGQEKSTRYVDFGKDKPAIRPEIIETILGVKDDEVFAEFAEIWNVLVGKHIAWLDTLTSDCAAWLLPRAKEHGLDIADAKDRKQVMGSVETRSLDVARNWLPMGTGTMMALSLSARHAIDLVGQLKARPDTLDQVLGQQILDLLNLNLYEGIEMQADLTGLAKSKYTESSAAYQANLGKLREELLCDLVDMPPMRAGQRPNLISNHEVEVVDADDAEKLFIGYASVAMPEASLSLIREIYRFMSDERKAAISSIIFDGHDNRQLMRSAADSRGIMVRAKMSAALMRDLNRQRAMGRNIVELETTEPYALLNSGFTSSYHLENAEFWQGHDQNWARDASSVYERIHQLADMIENRYGSHKASQIADLLLPLGAMTTSYISAPPSQWSYALNLRSNVGGDYGYRVIANEIIDDIRQTNPMMAALGRTAVRIDPNSAEQLLGRS